MSNSPAAAHPNCAPAAPAPAPSPGVTLSHVKVVRIDADSPLAQQQITDRQSLRSAVEAIAHLPFTIYALPPGATLTAQATLRDELIRRAAAEPWEVLRTTTANESDDALRVQGAGRWPPPPSPAAPTHLVQIGSIAPLGSVDVQPHEVLLAGQGMAEVVVQLDRVRVEMRRLLHVAEKDIGERRNDVLRHFAALTNARAITQLWADDQPVAANAYADGKPPSKREKARLFGVWIDTAQATLPWGALRASVFAELTANLHRALHDGRFADVAACRALPRVLILGESGAGKSLAVDYLARRVSEPGLRRLQRVPVPDYVGAEASLKHELFGYMPGSFTGAAERGEPGLLLNNIGGVIFLDEIGDASPELQAKLLAYLDDFCVRPVGYSDSPLPCPTLIVAATNRPVVDWADDHRRGVVRPDQSGSFRHDLLERFDTIVQLPSLKERIRDGDLPAIVDALLQTEAVNPVVDTGTGARRMMAIDPEAVDALGNVDYTGANLRKLTGLLKHATQRATAAGRKFIVVDDVRG